MFSYFFSALRPAKPVVEAGDAHTPEDQIETALRKTATIAPRKRGQEIQQIPDERVVHVATLLGILDKRRGRTGDQAWSYSPRTYIILMNIGGLPWMSKFVEKRYTDFQLPYDNRRLRDFIDDGKIREQFLEVQKSLLTSAKDLEILHSETKSFPHVHFDGSGDDHFTSIARLGQGSSGVVDHVWSNLSKEEYARKRVLRGRMNSEVNRRAQEAITREIKELKFLSHRHLVKVHGSYTDKEYIAFLMQPVASCNLNQFLRKSGGLTEGDRHDVRRFYGCLASAVHYLHQSKIRHRDLSAKNVLIYNGDVFVSDLGSSWKWSNTGGHNSATLHHDVPATISYIAPEVAKRQTRSSSSDMWSLGIVFLEMATLLLNRTLDEFQNLLDRTAKPRSLQPYVWANPPIVNTWVSKLQESNRGACHDNEPLVWIRDLLDERPENRPKSRGLMKDILESASFNIFCCLKCQEEYRERKFEWGTISSVRREDFGDSQAVMKQVATMLDDEPLKGIQRTPKRNHSVEMWLDRTTAEPDHAERPGFGYLKEPGVESIPSRTEDEEEEEEEEEEAMPMQEHIRDTGLGFFEYDSPSSSDDEDNNKMQFFNEIEDSSGSEPGSDATIVPTEREHIVVSEGSIPFMEGDDQPFDVLNHLPDDLDDEIQPEEQHPVPEIERKEHGIILEIAATEAVKADDREVKTVEEVAEEIHRDEEMNVRGVVAVKDHNEDENHALDAAIGDEGAAKNVTKAAGEIKCAGDINTGGIVAVQDECGDDNHPANAREMVIPNGPDSQHFSRLQNGDLPRTAEADRTCPIQCLPSTFTQNSQQFDHNTVERAHDRLAEGSACVDNLPKRTTEAHATQWTGQSPLLRLKDDDPNTTQLPILPEMPLQFQKETIHLMPTEEQPSRPTGEQLSRPIGKQPFGPTEEQLSPPTKEEPSLPTEEEPSLPTEEEPSRPTKEEPPQPTKIQPSQPTEETTSGPKEEQIFNPTKEPPSKLRPSSDMRDEHRARTSTGVAEAQPNQTRLSAANIKTLNQTEPLSRKKNQRKGRKPIPNVSASAYIEEVWEASSSIATSVMTSHTSELLKNFTFNKWWDRDHNLLEKFCAEGKVQAVRTLLAEGCNPGISRHSSSKPSGSRPGPILNAVRGASVKHNKCVRVLIEAGVNVNVVSRKRGKTPLHFAIENPDFDGYAMLIHDLIEAGADTNKPDASGNYPLMTLFKGNDSGPLEKHRRSALALLLRSEEAATQVNIAQQGTLNTPLHLAVRQKDVLAVGMLLHRKADVNAKNASGLTPLLISAHQLWGRISSEHLSVMHLLLETEGIEVDEKAGIYQQTALHQAVRAGISEAVDQLLQHGADPRLVDNQGRNALTLAIQHASNHRASEHADIMAQLVDAMEKPWSTEEGICILELACNDPDATLMQELLNHGMYPNIHVKGQSVIQRATTHSNTAVVQLLELAIQQRNLTPESGTGWGLRSRIY